MNGKGNIIELLANSPLFNDYERAYTEATGLPVCLRPADTWRLPLHGRRKENAWCALLAGKSRTCAGCLQIQEKLATSAVDKPAVVHCPYGLCEIAAPVKLGAQTIGYLQTGQVLRQKPTEALFERALEHAARLGVRLDKTVAREAYFNGSVLPRKKLESISVLLAIFAEHLSMKSNQIAVQQANTEPPVITKARQFIEEHHAEDLSLERVAEAVHTSLYYFCKLFRKATGIKFTEYVSRVRIEKAKNLLLNPNLRVSEIAYEVGFQSLTHFNRVFKSFVGESPRAYRAKLPATRREPPRR